MKIWLHNYFCSYAMWRRLCFFSYGAIHILRQQIFVPFLTHPLSMPALIKYQTSAKIAIFWTHASSLFADIIYEWSLWWNLESSRSSFDAARACSMVIPVVEFSKGGGAVGDCSINKMDTNGYDSDWWIQGRFQKILDSFYRLILLLTFDWASI